MNKLLVILGSTATGKTDLALSLAKKFNGELISCDSRQIYVGLDIGTGKLPNGRLRMENGRWKKGKGFWEIGGIKIWMYDVIGPRIQYTVADYVKDADRVIEEIRERGKLPILVGGSGLYIKALVDGLDNLGIPTNKSLRRELEKLTWAKLQVKLKSLSLEKWNSLNNSDRQNPRRLIRAIELSLSSLRAKRSNLEMRLPRRPTIGGTPRNDVLRIGLTGPREILYQRVDKHVISRINQGMIDEAINLHDGGLTLKRMKQLGLEYGVLADYLDGKIKDIKGDGGLIKIMQNKIHGYVRRQLTWFRKENDVNWFDITDKKYNIMVENLVAKWYYPS